MKLRLRMYALLFVSLMCSTFATATKAEVMQWKVAGVQRQAIVYAPTKKTASGKAPLVFAFHGHGDTMENFAEGTEFHKLWPEAIVVYPQGLPTNPSTDPEGYGWVYEPNQDALRDVTFVDAMLNTMHEKFHVDDQRVYATGFSQGAMFTYVLWDTRANVLAALGIVAGRILPTVHITVPRPALVIGGEQDQQVKFTDQLLAIDAARTLNGVEEGTSCGPRCTTYASSKGTPVVTYIHGGGHVYPNGTTERIVNFLKNYSLAP